MTVAHTRGLAGFPFPFREDAYRYTVNVEPARVVTRTPAGTWGASLVTIDSDYRADLRRRAQILAADPSRHVVPAHMRPAAWDALLAVLRELSDTYPAVMTLTRLGEDRWRWRNALLGEDLSFRYGAESDLPCEPLRYAASQVQEDITLLDQRNDTLYLDAGVVTFASGWSLRFDTGMTFPEIHGPVPRVRRDGVVARALEFLKRLEPDAPYRRLNWSLSVGDELDHSLENFAEWAPLRELLADADDVMFGRLVNLRVEVQHLIRLPASGAVMFLIRTHLLPLEQLATIDEWRLRTAAVLDELPADLAEYKGIAPYRARAAAWLRRA